MMNIKLKLTDKQQSSSVFFLPGIPPRIDVKSSAGHLYFGGV